MNGARPAGVRIDTRSMRRVRISASLTRWVLYVTAATGVAATVRFAVAPPRAPAAPAVSAPAEDLGAEGFATSFARRYLTWDAGSPIVHQRGLAPFVGGTIDADVGLGTPSRGAQRALGAEVIQARAAGPGEHVYTVAVDVAGGTATYLSVDVVRDGAGELALGRYPALIGPPVIHAATGLDGGSANAVTDAGVATVVERALRNYLAGSVQNLAADLAAGALVAAPPQPLTLDRLAGLRVARSGAVLATVAVHDGLATTYTLTYELGLKRGGGRWLVSAIQSDPRT